MDLQDRLDKRFSPQAVAFKRIISKVVQPFKIEKILVVGCGRGYEAIKLQELFGAKIHGVDVEQEFDVRAEQYAQLSNYDGETLPFTDNHFDIVYSFHVLEHVEDVDKMLFEMKRVINQGGWVYIGVPNRSRLFGYFGMKDKSFSQKLKQNLHDWQARIQGRFENRYGAHAGFSASELGKLLSNHFTHVENVTGLYYLNKRSYFKLLLHLPGFSKFILPSVYFLASK